MGKRIAKIGACLLYGRKIVSSLNFKLDSGEIRSTLSSQRLLGQAVSTQIESGNLLGFYGTRRTKTNYLEHFGLIVRD